MNNEQIAAVAIVATAGGIVIGRMARKREQAASPTRTSASRASTRTNNSSSSSDASPLRELAMGAAVRMAGLALDRVEAHLRSPIRATGPIVADYGNDEPI